MSRRIVGWLRSQFIAPHRWRDEDIEYWWQMPDDRSRTKSPWLQLGVDLVTRSTFSEWHQRVAMKRVTDYDKLRPTVTRLVFLVLIGSALWALGAPWWCWLLVVPAALQVAAEIHVYPYLQESAPEPRWRFVRRMRDIADEHYRTALLNVTGVIGVIACPANVVAACFAPPGADHGWIKVVALASSLMYLNSGLASSFLDPPNYRETSNMPPVMHSIRPYAPVVSFAVVLGIVAASVEQGRWEPAMIPVAYVCATLTLLLGSTIRNHDRVIAAAAPVARHGVEEGRREFGTIVHDDLGPIKQAVESASQVGGIPFQQQIDLLTLSAYLTHFSTRAGLFAMQQMDLPTLIRKVGSPYGISGRRLVLDIRWNADDMGKENNRVAIRVATALIHNVGQALQRELYLDTSREIRVEAYVTGEDRDLRYHLAVRDHLPLIGDENWCAAGTSQDGLRTWLRGSFVGDLVQEDVGDGTKRIAASWADRPPIGGYAESREGASSKP